MHSLPLTFSFRRGWTVITNPYKFRPASSQYSQLLVFWYECPFNGRWLFLGLFGSTSFSSGNATTYCYLVWTLYTLLIYIEGLPSSFFCEFGTHFTKDDIVWILWVFIGFGPFMLMDKAQLANPAATLLLMLTHHGVSVARQSTFLHKENRHRIRELL